MKSTLKKLLALIIVLFILITNFNCISMAENETIESSITNSDVPQDIAITSENSESNIEAEASNTQNKNVFLLSQEDITLDYDVIGDVFICSSKTVHISSTIYGNVFIVANEIDIEPNAFIQCSLFTTSSILNVKGNIYSTIYSVCQTFSLEENSSLNSDLYLTCQSANINGYIFRDAYISAETLNISDSTIIGRDLKYSANEEQNISSNIVKGNISYSPIVTNNKEENISLKITEFVYGAISYIIFVLVIFAIYKFLCPKFAQNSSKNLTSRLGKTIGLGALGVFIIPIICFILLMLDVTLRVSLILLGIYVILLAIGSGLFMNTLSNLITEKIFKGDKINNTLKGIISLIVIAIIYRLLKLIPVVGALITFIAVLIGIGIFITGILPSKNKD